jgi:Acyl-CoA carboxylase epsilon subunit
MADSHEPGEPGQSGEPGAAGEPGEPTPEQRRALFRVVRGEPDDIEVAALTVVLAAAASAGASAGPGGGRRTSVWTDRRAMLRQQLHPGPGAWRSSILPR